MPPTAAYKRLSNDTNNRPSITDPLGTSRIQTKHYTPPFPPPTFPDPPTPMNTSTNDDGDKFWRRKRRIVQASMVLLGIFLMTGFIVSVSMKDSLPSFLVLLTSRNTGKAFQNAVISTEHPVCSLMAAQAMEAGGSAVDAAIRAMACIGVVHPFSAGLGGGGFLLIDHILQFKERADEPVMLDFREAAPLSDSLVRSDGEEEVIGMPGELAGMLEAHARWGKLAWAKLFGPVIGLASEGFPLTPFMHNTVQKYLRKVQASSGLARIYLDAAGRPLPIGAVIKRPDLADTWSAISKGHTFYDEDGPLRRSLLATLSRNESSLKKADFAQYVVKERQVLQEKIAFGQTELLLTTGGPPTSGPVVVHMLKVLAGFADAKHPLMPYNPRDVHRLVETLKWGAAGRLRLGDPDDLEVQAEIQAVLHELISDSYARQVRDVIEGDDRTHSVPHYFWDTSNSDDVQKWDDGTTHISVIQGGMGVSCMSTVNSPWGSGIVDPGTGILFNDELDDFRNLVRGQPDGSQPVNHTGKHNEVNSRSFVTRHDSQADAIKRPHRGLGKYNRTAPGKRPQSSSAPLTLKVYNNGSLEQVYVMGGTGGPRILSATLQTLIGVLWWGRTLEGAIAAPRFHHQLLPHNELLIEPEYADLDTKSYIVKEIRKRGHVVKVDGFAGAMQAVQYNALEGVLTGASDRRKGGAVDGY